jgi:LemA protein
MIFVALLIIGTKLVVIITVITRNGLLGAHSGVQESLDQMDNQLRRRNDLSDTFVETAKGCMPFEMQTLYSVTRARNLAQHAGSRSDKFKQEEELSQALGRLMVVAQKYPDLRDDFKFQSLLKELSATENGIASSRQAYNDRVTIYHKRRDGFFGRFLAQSGEFPKATFWKVGEAIACESDAQKS